MKESGDWWNKLDSYKSIKIYGIDNGVKTEKTNLELNPEFNITGLRKIAITLEDKMPPNQNKRSRGPHARLTQANVIAFYKFITEGYKSKYTDVKKMDIWKSLYEVDNYLMYKMDRSYRYDPYVIRTLGTLCRKCEYLFPLVNLTIDHQKPQVGGETLAIARIFRGLGLTIGRPRRSTKNGHAFKHHAKEVGGDLGASVPLVKKSADSITLNHAGMIYYSVICAMNDEEELKKYCMHHYLNLRPLCNRCNSSIGNSNV